MAENTGRALSRGLLRCLASISREHARLSRSPAPAPGAEWLLDNWYLIEREGRLAASELRRAGRLRGCAEGGALIACLCRRLVRDCGGEVTEERASRFLSEAQAETPLRMRELGLFAPCLRLALVEDIAASLSGGPDPEPLSACINSLRLFATLDLTQLLEGADLVEAALRRDPAGVYPQMDERSRAYYRERLRLLAKKRGVDEHELAAELIERSGESGHVGALLLPEPRSGRGYALAQLLPALILSAGLAVYFRSLPLFFPALAALWELSKAVCDFVLLRVLPPRLIPRLELAGGVPDEGRCICVVSSLLSGEDSGPELARSSVSGSSDRPMN